MKNIENENVIDFLSKLSTDEIREILNVLNSFDTFFDIFIKLPENIKNELLDDDYFKSRATGKLLDLSITKCNKLFFDQDFKSWIPPDVLIKEIQNSKNKGNTKLLTYINENNIIKEKSIEDLIRVLKLNAHDEKNLNIIKEKYKKQIDAFNKKMPSSKNNGIRILNQKIDNMKYEKSKESAIDFINKIGIDAYKYLITYHEYIHTIFYDIAEVELNILENFEKKMKKENTKEPFKIIYKLIGNLTPWHAGAFDLIFLFLENKKDTKEEKIKKTTILFNLLVDNIMYHDKNISSTEIKNAVHEFYINNDVNKLNIFGLRNITSSCDLSKMKKYKNEIMEMMHPLQYKLKKELPENNDIKIKTNLKI